MAKVSHVATIVAPSSMLLQIFAACPLPASPAWMTVLPMADKIGLARSNALSVPPTMKVNVPPAAAAIPPETRSEEHPSELQSLMRSSYAVFCLIKTTSKHRQQIYYQHQ